MVKLKCKVKQFILRKFQELISWSIGYNAVLVGSEIRMLKQDISCLRGSHNWSNWSSKLCGNIVEMEADYKNRYSYRHCFHCNMEMPESRIYHESGFKEKNAIEYSNQL